VIPLEPDGVRPVRSRAPAASWLVALLAFGLVVPGGGCRPTDPTGRGVPGMDLSGVELTELEARGRQIFVRERCVSCHIVGAPPPSTFRGSARAPGRRIGPTLADVGGRFTDAWHHAFLGDPRRLIVTSTMPAYPWLIGPDGEPTDDARALVAWLQTQRDPDLPRDPDAAIAASLAAPTEAAAGALVYRRSCAGCHGEDGTPPAQMTERFFPPPRDLTEAEYALVPRDAGGRPDRERLLALVTRGVGRTDMPGHWYLEPADLSSVVAHVRDLAGEGDPDAPPPRLPAQRSAEDRRLGPGMWVALGCESCHGLSGRGDGPLAPDTIFDLTEGVLKGGRDATHLAWVIWRGLPGTPMPAFDAALEALGPEALSGRLEAVPEGEARTSLAALIARLPEMDVATRLGVLVDFVMEITDAEAPSSRLEDPRAPPPASDASVSDAPHPR
jgi:mono/diheme cytochrome c family protein